MADIEYSVDDTGVATLLLNRPEVKNAFHREMIDEWVEHLESARLDPAVRVIVLTGAGEAFCAGADLKRPTTGAKRTPLERKQSLIDNVHRVPLALENLDKPIIAGINGVAVGAGMDMALMCDMRVMASHAKVSEGYIRVGMVPGDGGCYYLPRLVGLPKALELLLTGEFISAEEAGRLGIANHVVDRESFHDVVYGLARKIAAQPPFAVRMIKRATYQSSRSDLRTALDLISSHMSVVTSMQDSAEAMAAFREKRPAQYRGV